MDLTDQVRRFTLSLRKAYAPEIEKDRQAFKDKVTRLIRCGLPRGRTGRPKHEEVTRAVELRSQNKPWAEVYKTCIEGFSNLPSGERELAMIRLRSAVRTRQVRERRTKADRLLSRQQIPA